MIKIGITGQSGFIGTHLFNFFGLKKDEVIRIPFQDEYFSDSSLLDAFVKQCDVIIHLAALNRHNDPQTIYDTNILLVHKLIAALDHTGAKPHLLFSSSTQEERDNMFGKSKREGRELLAAWAEKNNAPFTGLVIPNVFGPFGHPYYNSVVATFCHQVTHGEQPKIEIDAELKLIYINELVQLIWQVITNHQSPVTNHQSPITNHQSPITNHQSPVTNHQSPVTSHQSPVTNHQSPVTNHQSPVTSHQSPVTNHQSPVTNHHFKIQQTSERTVMDILEQINRFKTDYFDKGIFPELRDTFERDLFNTFRCYMDIPGHYPVKLIKNTDERGSFVETIKSQLGGQVSFSTTKPGITRGNHFHTRKIERFAVIKGTARIQLRRIGTNEVLNYDLDGNEPSYVDMPIWYTHNITNTGTDYLYTIFWINEFYDPSDPDTFFEEVELQPQSREDTK